MSTGLLLILLFVIGMVIGGAFAWYKAKHPTVR